VSREERVIVSDPPFRSPHGNKFPAALSYSLSGAFLGLDVPSPLLPPASRQVENPSSICSMLDDLKIPSPSFVTAIAQKQCHPRNEEVEEHGEALRGGRWKRRRRELTAHVRRLSLISSPSWRKLWAGFPVCVAAVHVSLFSRSSPRISWPGLSLMPSSFCQPFHPPKG